MGPKVLLADQHKDVLSALQLVLYVYKPDWKIFVAQNESELFHQLKHNQPDLVLMDWDLFQKTNGLYNTSEALGLIVFGMDPTNGPIVIQMGASAYVCKADPPETVLRVLLKWEKKEDHL